MRASTRISVSARASPQSRSVRGRYRTCSAKRPWLPAVLPMPWPPARNVPSAFRSPGCSRTANRGCRPCRACCGRAATCPVPTPRSWSAPCWRATCGWRPGTRSRSWAADATALSPPPSPPWWALSIRVFRSWTGPWRRCRCPGSRRSSAWATTATVWWCGCPTWSRCRWRWRPCRDCGPSTRSWWCWTGINCSPACARRSARTWSVPG